MYRINDNSELVKIEKCITKEIYSKFNYKFQSKNHLLIDGYECLNDDSESKKMYSSVCIYDWDKDYPFMFVDGVRDISIRCNYPFPIDMLPSSVINLSLIKYTREFINLPSQLQICYLEISTYNFILPDTIQILNLHINDTKERKKRYIFGYNDFKGIELFILPKSLRVLSLSLNTYIASNLDTILMNLNYLEVLDIRGSENIKPNDIFTDLELTEFPISLKCLYLPWFKLPITNLTDILMKLSNLETVDLGCNLVFCLPRKVYKIYTMINEIFEYIPDNVIILHIKPHPFKYNDFITNPYLVNTNIRHLIIEPHNYDLHYIPKNLETIVVLETNINKSISEICKTNISIKLVKMPDWESRYDKINFNMSELGKRM